MAGTTFGIVMIVIAALAGLVVMETLVLAADRSPYFKHPHPDRIWDKVRGGVHLGDPRSLEAPYEDEVRPAGEQPPGQTGAGAGDEGGPAQPRS